MKRPRIKSNEATILTILGGIGLIATAVLTAKETPKAIKLMEEAKNEKGEDLTPIETAITVAPAYVPAIAVGVSSLLCIFSANVLNKKTQASLMSAYSMAGNMYRDYRKKNIEMFGEENDRAIIDDIQRYYCDYHQIGINTPDAKVRWYEPLSGTFIEAYEREIMDAEYHFNRNFVLRGESCINDWLEMLGIAPISNGDTNGWCIQDEMYWVDFEHRIEEDSKGCYYVIDTVFSPEDLTEYMYW